VPAPYQLQTTRPYLTNQTYRENAETLRDSEGQQRYRAVSRDLTITSANAREQQRPCSHAVYGMQEVKAWKALA
jgi:hypothetical protein